jgi:hypothetical protein
VSQLLQMNRQLVIDAGRDGFLLPRSGPDKDSTPYRPRSGAPSMTDAPQAQEQREFSGLAL